MGITPYHICYEVDNIEQSIVELRNQSFMIILKPVEAIAFGIERYVIYIINMLD
jgi:methylmalonyl-CoA/ethylmalonyl-CoA epimerase